MDSSSNKSGLLIVVSGFSGAGKGSLIKELMSHHDNYCLSISMTTRKPREGEIHGREYFFVSQEEFEAGIQSDNFLENAKYVDHYYGTPKDFVLGKIADGKDVLLEIEIQGAIKIKQKYPNALLVFVTPPNAATLMERLSGRGTETKEEIAARLSRAAEESHWMDGYDYILINDDLSLAAERLHDLVMGQHMKVSENAELIKTIQQDMDRLYLKEEK